VRVLVLGRIKIQIFAYSCVFTILSSFAPDKLADHPPQAITSSTSPRDYLACLPSTPNYPPRKSTFLCSPIAKSTNTTLARRLRPFVFLLVSCSLSFPSHSITNRLAARTRVRKGPPPKRLHDSDGTDVLVRKEKVADTTNTTATPTAGPVAALAMGVGDAENDVNFSGVSPPGPGTFVEPFPLACHSGFHVVTAGSKVGITPHWFVRFLSIRNTVSLTIQTTGQLLRTPSAANARAQESPESTGMAPE
jgi:hypothetical protein